MKLSKNATEHNGNKLWPLEGNLIECTYNQDFEIVDFWINRVKVEQDDLIVELADEYDTEQTRRDIEDYERSEYAYSEFVTIELEGIR